MSVWRMRQSPTLHADQKHVLPSLAGDESTLLSAALQQSIRGDGRAHTHTLDLVKAQLRALWDLAAFELAKDTPDTARLALKALTVTNASVGASG